MTEERNRKPWLIAWVVWLVAFLIVEVSAAVRKTKLDTLSENVWLWFGIKYSERPYKGTRRAALALFMLTLSGHFVFGWPGGLGVILTGIPVGAVITYALFFERGEA